MGWPRSPLPARRLHGTIDDTNSAAGESDDAHEGDSAEWTPSNRSIPGMWPCTPAVMPTGLAFQPSYVYDENEELQKLQIERRARKLRNCICCGVCAFTLVVGLVCFSMVLSSSLVPQAQAMNLMNRIEKAALVQFKITPKPQLILEPSGKRREVTTAFHGFTYIHGELTPFVSCDRGLTRRVSFNGWIRAYTNTSVSYDMMLLNHRGYRIMRSAPFQHSRSRCVTFDDIPPLHYLSASAERAFRAQDWASFRMNCSRAEEAPVEIVFAHTPFVFCPADVSNNILTIVPRSTNASDPTRQLQTLEVHGERMLVEITMSDNTEEAMRAHLKLFQEDTFEIWGNSTGGFAWTKKCPYLEAPLASYSPRSSQMIDDLLGNTSSPRVPPRQFLLP